MPPRTDYTYQDVNTYPSQPPPPYPGPPTRERQRRGAGEWCCYLLLGCTTCILILSLISAVARIGTATNATACNATALCPGNETSLPCFEFACLTIEAVNYCVLAAVANCSIV